jgi:type IV pilus assembly protein PilE
MKVIGATRPVTGRAMPARIESARGMTLLELVIALAVSAVLAVGAMSSYRQHVLRTHRTEAKTALLRLHAAQERFYTRNGNRYTSNLTLLGYSTPTDAPTAGGRYLLSVDPDAGTLGFTARAVASGAMTNDRECRELTIDAQGLRGASPDPHDRCW